MWCHDLAACFQPSLWFYNFIRYSTHVASKKRSVWSDWSQLAWNMKYIDNTVLFIVCCQNMYSFLWKVLILVVTKGTLFTYIDEICIVKQLWTNLNILKDSYPRVFIENCCCPCQCYTVYCIFNCWYIGCKCDFK